MEDTQPQNDSQDQVSEVEETVTQTEEVQTEPLPDSPTETTAGASEGADDPTPTSAPTEAVEEKTESSTDDQ